MPSLNFGNTSKNYANPGSSPGYGGYYNPTSPQFYNNKQPYKQQPPANPNLPKVQPGNPASIPKPITGSPYPKFNPIKQPYNYKPPVNPNLPTVQPGNPASIPKPITNIPYPNLKQPLNIPKLPNLAPFKPTLPSGGGLVAPRGGILPGGGVAGGLAAGAALLWAYNFHQLYKLWNLAQPESKPEVQPDKVVGGNDAGTLYWISGLLTATYRKVDSTGEVIETISGVTTQYNTQENYVAIPGVIQQITKSGDTFGGGSGAFGIALRSTSNGRHDINPISVSRQLDWNSYSNNTVDSVLISVRPLDQPAPQLDQPPTQKRSAPPIEYNPNPAPIKPPAPTTQPPKLQPDPTPQITPNPQKPPIRLNIPNNQPLTFTSLGNPPLVINQVPPQATPEQPKLPKQPTEIKFPRNTPPEQPQPIEIKPPGSPQPLTFTSPGSGPVTINIPGFKPITVDAKNTGKPEGATPDTFKPNNFAPIPSTPTPPSTTPTPNPTDPPTPEPEIPNVLIPATILATLTPLLQQILSNTNPANVAPVVSSAVCKTTQPGGCMTNLANNSANNAANNAANKLFDRLNAAANLGQLALLKPIKDGVDLANTKLGAPIANGGISGFIQRAYQATHIDKALNAMNTVLLVHNAAMLSRNLGSTLGDLTSQALSTIGIKDAEGSPIDINKEIGTQVNSFMENLVGAEVWRGTKTSWNKASSIISSATNIMYTVRSMFDSGREILEWTAENTGKIGNALKKYRIVGEDAYKWMPERVTVQNAFTRRLDRIREGTDSLDDAASSLTGVLGEVQSIQQEYADLQEQKQRFDANIKDLTPKSREENKPVADAVTAARTASKAPTSTENVFRGEGENNA